nr:MAK10-like protein [Tanacetum cinerariifolium]
MLRDNNDEESWALLEDLALYDNASWNDPRDFAEPVKAISMPQDVPSTSDQRLTKFENQVQRLMEAHLAPNQPVQVNKIASSCDIYSGLHDTQYCMENIEQAFVEYASSHIDVAGAKDCYNSIMTTPLEHRKDSKSPSGIKNFTGRVRGMPIFIGNFKYASNFMIVEDISSVIDPRMSPVVLGKPFVELSNMTYDISLGVFELRDCL